MSSNFERLHEIINDAYAENFSCLIHWEPKKIHMWASISVNPVPLYKMTTFSIQTIMGEKSSFSVKIVAILCICSFATMSQWLLSQPDSGLKSESSETVNLIEKSNLNQNFDSFIDIYSRTADDSLIHLRSQKLTELPQKYLSICTWFLQFSSLMNWIFLPAVACNIQVWNRLKI